MDVDAEVSRLGERQVSDLSAFNVRGIAEPDPEAYERFPDQPMDERRLAGTFKRFGMPDRLAG